MNHQYQKPIQDDVSEISHYTTPPTSPVSQTMDHNTNTIRLDSLKANIKNRQNQNNPRSDNINNIFEDLLQISDTTSQKSNSTSNVTLSHFVVESQQNDNSIEQKEEKEVDLIKIDLIQFEFSYPTKPQSSIKSNESGDMAFLYHCNKNIISVCFNKMQCEAAIPLNQLTGFCITSDEKILIKLKKNYQHYFSHHLGGFPYLLDPTPMDYDPTNNKFDKAQSLLLTPPSSERLLTLSSLESRIDRLYFCKHGIHNDVITEDGLKMYITCIFLHERRAIAFPFSGTFHKLLDVMESRFGKKSPAIHYRKNNESIEIKNDGTWRAVKDKAIGKKLLRLELHII
ncbi:hypothetical protein C1645_751230 [Glomus cerebriforme]|uniref:Uncharacterized protein n=1 Tax=Glomus cerebriforme TaxID=658196 RepID=A0A397TNA6_9GLOM|nr:hypothetical protein C1645_751230 [Glomus cerebriforme]